MYQFLQGKSFIYCVCCMIQNDFFGITIYPKTCYVTSVKPITIKFILIHV